MIVAAMAVKDGATIADPFRSTAPIVAMLRLRADQINGTRPRSRRTLPLRPPAPRRLRTPRARPRLLAPAGVAQSVRAAES